MDTSLATKAVTGTRTHPTTIRYRRRDPHTPASDIQHGETPTTPCSRTEVDRPPQERGWPSPPRTRGAPDGACRGLHLEPDSNAPRRQSPRQHDSKTRPGTRERKPNEPAGAGAYPLNHHCGRQRIQHTGQETHADSGSRGRMSTVRRSTAPGRGPEPARPGQGTVTSPGGGSKL